MFLSFLQNNILQLKPDFNLYYNKLEHTSHNIYQYILKNVANKKHQLAALDVSLQKLSPLHTLARGYAVVIKGNQTITKCEDLNSGDLLNIVLSNGDVKAKVIDD